MRTTADDYRKIEKAILFLDKHRREKPGLKEVARQVNLSEYHFQRLFKRWAGISPKRFLQALTLRHAKKTLKRGAPLLDAAYETGLSSASRLHDLFVTMDAVTPGEFRRKGARLTIRYGFHASPFGECLIAVTTRGICHLAFLGREGRSSAVALLKRQWRNADIVEDAESTGRVCARIFGPSQKASVPLFVRGTNFQTKVWQALLRIPGGSSASYGDIARAIGRPGAARAVANAAARNPVAFLIPCHRVIRKTGAVGGYRWGGARKKAILAWEAAHAGR
jgi:AraC family transcriptional regulator of adaptative response/methylated-DNA-[protein]-cysteine methyltransferase